MSATPEQIAELCDRLKKRVLNADDLDVASSLIRAQAERVRVLEEALRSALGWVGHWQRDVEGNLKPTPESLATAYAEIRTALKAAP